MSSARAVSRCIWSLPCLAAAPSAVSAQAPEAGVAAAAAEAPGADFAAAYAGEVALEAAAGD